MPRHLVSVDDIRDSELESIFLRARQFRTGARDAARSSRLSGRVVGLLFLQTSLRTRVGFATACARLGWQSVSVFEQRASEVSMAESIDDTLRVAGGMVDLMVTRLPVPVGPVASSSPVPVISGGDAGPLAEHPTQALIDVFAMEQERGRVGDLHIAICGDLRMRSARSLTRLLLRRRPRKLSLISVPALMDPVLAGNPDPILDRCQLSEVSDVDVLYVTGIPHQAIPEDVRDTLRVTSDVMKRLPKNAVVLSPMPVIDEIDSQARCDDRIKMFNQSDNGVYVRMAVLEAMGDASAA
ncbi:hypothetical protein KAK07_11820 [Ideonella sp. 4Y16]|uniref:hypothetical protein n=1 Tax=Ideonella alba TaxID=2824118 RepID=UPI001B392F3D|nr:hypothetical protein [Ideonella alba]MBQ0944022.1 hypothetical protein [Ideonella alba]